MDEKKPPATPPASPRHRAIFILRDEPPWAAGRVIADPDGTIADRLDPNAHRPATRAEIAIAGLALEIPEE